MKIKLTEQQLKNVIKTAIETYDLDRTQDINDIAEDMTKEAKKLCV